MVARAIFMTFVLIVSLASAAAADTAVTGQVYVRHDGGSDSVITNCNSNDPANAAGNNLEDNEPALAMKPDEPTYMAVGANDYCSDWLGVHASDDAGASWTDSLLPGYPGDTSTEGQASPLFGRSSIAADPLVDWDNDGNLFVGGIAFNFEGAQNGDVFVGTYSRDSTTPLGIDYLRTALVGRGTPAPFPGGRFLDKPSLKVDDWSGSSNEGNVYVAWTRFVGQTSTNTAIYFSRSTDQARRFSTPVKVSKDLPNAQGSEVAVAPDGTVYVFWRQFARRSARLADAILFVKSTNAGRSFSKPKQVRTIVPYDRTDVFVNDGPADDCGDGDLLCVSNFVFHRTGSFPQATTDDNGNVYLTWEEVLPAPDNGDSYRPDGQSRVVVTKSTNGGTSWSTPVTADPQPVGHQWWPNLEYDKAVDRLALIYYDSRYDPAYSVYRPPGNLADGTSVCGTPIGSSPCNVLNTFLATSSDGTTWSSTQVSSVGHQPEYETRGDGQIPFLGDYLWVDAAGGTVYGVWTDNRDVVPGTDPREAVQDGFDVLQCRATPDSPDTCPNAGGRNQNIYGAALPL